MSPTVERSHGVENTGIQRIPAGICNLALRLAAYKHIKAGFKNLKRFNMQ
jgi:hypothetical protein